jgi:plastocyanin
MSGPAPTARRRRMVLALVAVPVLLLLVVALFSRSPDAPVVVEVPLGTAARIAAGEEVVLVPETLEVEVGDTLEIRNHDVYTHEVGPYLVAAGQVLEQTFTSPGVIEGVCSLNPMGEVRIVVR